MSEVAAADATGAVGTVGTADPVTELDVSEVDESWLADTLESTPAGAELAALLATVERAGLAGDQLLTLARARNRQIAHQQAQLLADLHRVARTVPAVGDPPPAGGGMVAKYPWAQVECAFALTWTTVKAGGELELADELIDRLPVVYAGAGRRAG